MRTLRSCTLQRTPSVSTTVSSDGDLIPQDTVEADSQAMMDIDSEATVDADFNAIGSSRNVSTFFILLSG
jgi:hypothetical protein